MVSKERIFLGLFIILILCTAVFAISFRDFIFPRNQISPSQPPISFPDCSLFLYSSPDQACNANQFCNFYHFENKEDSNWGKGKCAFKTTYLCTYTENDYCKGEDRLCIDDSGTDVCKNTIPCRNTQDCEENLNSSYICDAEQGKCIVADNSCTKDIDCGDRTKRYCLNNNCVDKVSPREDSDCDRYDPSGAPISKGCQLSPFSVCVKNESYVNDGESYEYYCKLPKYCLSEKDCPFGSLCNGALCVKPQCGNDLPTLIPYKFDLSLFKPSWLGIKKVYYDYGNSTGIQFKYYTPDYNYQASSCNKGLHSEYTCSSNNLCLKRECILSFQCQTGETCYYGICKTKQCTENEDCGGGNICNGGICEKTNCANDEECVASGGICEQGRCIAKYCMNNKDCPGGNEKCDGNRCVYVEPTTCTKNDDCASGKVCDVSQSLCVLRQCTPPFTEGCAEGQLCDNGLCKEIGCYNDNTCPGQICSRGQCTTQTCVDDTGCPGSPARVCLNNICQTKLCSDNSECPTEFSCVDGRCAQ